VNYSDFCIPEKLNREPSCPSSMKRFYSLFFLVLILLNTVGYYEVLVIIDRHEHDRAVKKITENEETIAGNLLLKLPLSSPYGQQDTEYQRVYGEVTVAGQVYHFVKQKVYHDTLYVVCVTDAHTTKVKDVIADYSKSFADQPQGSNTPGKTVTSLAKYYTMGVPITSVKMISWSIVSHETHLEDLYSFSAITSVFHPPSQS